MEINYCKAREGDWSDLDIQNLEGEDASDLFNQDNSVWVICIATCSDTGMSIITDDWDTYYLVASIDLEYATALEALGALERGM